MNHLSAALCLALACLSLTPGAARAAEDEDRFRLGAHALRRILHDKEFKPLRGWSDIEDPASTVLILMGNTIPLDQIPGGLADFLDRGGAVLIATDQPLMHPALTGVCNYRVGDQYVRAWPPFERNPREPGWPGAFPDRRTWRVSPKGVFQEQVDCLILQPVEKARPDVFWGHDQFGRQTTLLEVATNRANFLAEVRPGRTPASVRPLAYFPRAAWYGHYGTVDPPQPVAVHAQLGLGHLFLFSDHSIFINEMMLRRDPQTGELLGNLDLADNIVATFATAGSRRNRALMIHDGEVVTRFDVPIVEIPLPLREIERMLVANADNAFSAIQDAHQEDRRLDEWFLDAFDGPNWLARHGGFYFLLALAATLGFCAYGLSRLVRASHTVEPAMPLFGRAQSRVAPTGSVLEERLEAMAQDNNYAAVARAAAQEWFATLSIPPAGPRPRVDAQGGWWRRWQTRRLIDRLWALARGHGQRRISAKKFQQLLGQMDELGRLVRQDMVRLS